MHKQQSESGNYSYSTCPYAATSMDLDCYEDISNEPSFDPTQDYSMFMRETNHEIIWGRGVLLLSKEGYDYTLVGSYL